jgi:mannose-6-phosphate isomerase-like protein (cupin superfamily)
MARIRIHDSNTGEWQLFRDLTPPDMIGRFTDRELSSTVFMHEMGDDKSLQLAEMKYLPNVTIDHHAHDEDEIFFVLAGELRAGSRVLGPGCSMFVAGGTLYSLSVGEAGAHFLAFRPRRDLTYMPRDEFERRRAQPSSEG